MNERLQMASGFASLNPNEMLGEGIVAGGFPRIGMRGKFWKVIIEGVAYSFIRDDGDPLPNLDVVILNQNPKTSKVYYPGTYTEGSQEAPTCAAIDGIKPDPGVPSPQSPTCAECRHNAWLPGRKGKECQDHRRLAVLLLPYMKTDPPFKKPFAEPVFLKITPDSLRSYKEYGESLVARGVHYSAVITRISFEPNQQFRLKFTMQKLLTDREAPLIMELREGPKTMALLGSGLAMLPPPTAAPPLRRVPVDDVPAETGLVGALTAAPPSARPDDEESTSTKRGRGRPAKPKAAETVEQGAAGWQDLKGDEEDTGLNSLLGDLETKIARHLPK